MRPLIYSLSIALIAGSVGVGHNAALAQSKESPAEAREEVEEASENARKQARDVKEETREATQRAKEETRETARDLEVKQNPNRNTEAIPAAPAINGEAQPGTPKIEERVRQRQNDLQEVAPNDNRRMRNNQRGDLNARGNVNQLGIWLDDSASTGVVVGRVAPNSPAARMGLRRGDRIVRFNNQQYVNRSAFRDSLRNWTATGPVPIVYVRDGRQYSHTMPLTAWNQESTQSQNVETPETYANNMYDQEPQPYTAARPIYDDGYQYSDGVIQPCAGQVVQPVIVDPCDFGYHNSFGYDRFDRRAMRQHRRMTRRAY